MVAGFKEVRCCRQLGRAKRLGQALSHAECYLPRNTTRASTAFTPRLDGSTISGLMSFKVHGEVRYALVTVET